MSTAEDQPAIGTPEYHRTRPPSVYTAGALEFRRTHIWTDHQGIIQGNIALGAVEITFHNPQQVRDLIGYLAGLAEEMDAEVKRQRPAEVVNLPEPACAKCHAAPVKPDNGRFCACCLDICHEALEFDHCCMICAAPEEAKALGYRPRPACSDCGDTEIPLNDSGVCWNRDQCAERVAARDAEAAQVTR